LEKLGLNLGFIIVQIINFGILFVVLRAWVYKPLLGMLEKRKQAIAQGLEDARVAADARANAERDAAAILSEAQMKANEVVRASSERAEAAAREIHATAEAEIGKAREGAMAEIEQERNRLLGELRGQVVTLAIAAAQKLVGESLDDARQHALLKDFFSGVKAGKVVVLEGENLSGGAAEVTSALPLTSDEQIVVKRDVVTVLGGSAAVSFRVDPSILGGLVVKVGDRVVDGSVAGQLQALRQNLQ
jgi:F-type H+-transporting ATPase subunit b